MNILDTVQYIPCHPKNHGGSRKAGQIKYLVFHYTGNDGDHDTNNAKYYQTNVKQASAHYFVDDDSITQSVPDLTVAWAVGGKKWADCPKTGGGSLYGIVTNANSLSIEMCDTSRDGKLMATEATLDRAAKLGRALMQKYRIPISHVCRHFDVTGKHCPAYFMDAAAWSGFKARLLEKEEEIMTQETFNQMFQKAQIGNMYHYIKDMPDWAQEAATKALQNGYLKMESSGAVNLYDVNLQTLVWLYRAGLLDAPAKH